MGSPSGRMLERAPERFLMATEACSGGTPDVGFFLEVWVYIRRVGVGNKSVGSPRQPRDRGARPPPGRALHPRGPLVAPLTDFFRLYIPIYPKNIEGEDRSGVPPPQASVATKNQSGPCSGTLTEGGSLTGGHHHHPGALHDKEGVVHPRG